MLHKLKGDAVLFIPLYSLSLVFSLVLFSLLLKYISYHGNSDVIGIHWYGQSLVMSARTF